MLFGGGMPGKQKEEEKEEDQPGPSKKPSSTSLDSKIVLGKRKRENKKKEGLTLDNKDSNLSIELKISDSEEKEKEEEAETEAPVIGTNLKNDELAQLLKPVILNLYDTCVELRNWITVLVPKVEDGNNFGVEVQEQCIAQLKQFEIESLMLFEEQAAYHLERATIISKISQTSEILDYKQYIYESDERRCRKLQESAYKLRANFNQLYRTLTQNYDRITAPRGTNQNHLHLY